MTDGRVIPSGADFHASTGLPGLPRCALLRGRMKTPVRLALGALALARMAIAGTPPNPIPQDPTAEPVPAFVGSPAAPRRGHTGRLPPPPVLAPNRRGNIHDGADPT